MRARRHHWIPTAIAAVVVVTMGCRGSNPLGGMVQVTNDPAVELPDVEAPPQRLASAKSRVAATPEKERAREKGSAPSPPRRRSSADTVSSLASARTRRPTEASSDASSGRTSGSAKPADAKQEKAKAPATGLAAGASSADAVMKDIQAALGSTEAAGNPSTVSSENRSAEKPASASIADDGSPVERSGKTLAERAAEKLAALPESERAELLQAFRNSPPEVQQQAMRQLVATAAQDADSTDQPTGIEDALTQSLDDLPELSDQPANDTGAKPTRLASHQKDGEEPTNDEAKSSSTAQRITLSDQPAGSSDEVENESESEPSPPVPGSVAQAVGTESSSKGGAVQTALATESPGGDPTAVAQAAVKSEVSAGDAKPEQLSNQQLYDLLLKRLSQPVEGENEADRSRRKIMARHLMVLSGNPDRAVEEVEGLSTKEQEYLRHQLLGLWTIIDPKGHPVPGRRFTTALPQFREATKYLAAATDTLEVRSLAFCTEAAAYGQIKKFPSSRFQPGQSVILYYELENFTAERVDNGYEIHLAASYVIYDSDDQKVFSQVLPTDRQISNRHIRDYYIAFELPRLPQLDPGDYRLEVTVEDVNGKKYGQSDVAFEMTK